MSERHAWLHQITSSVSDFSSFCGKQGNITRISLNNRNTYELMNHIRYPAQLTGQSGGSLLARSLHDTLLLLLMC